MTPHAITHPTNIDPDETLSLIEVEEGEHAHVTNFWTMTWVLLLLLFFTALTVWTSNQHHIPIGNTVIEFGTTLHIIMALLIGVVKAGLVAAFFMHLLYDKPMNTVVLSATLFGVVLFLGLTLSDLASRNVISRAEYSRVVLGGDTHYAPDGTRTKGAGVVQAARERAPEAHGLDGGDVHSGDAKEPGPESAAPGSHDEPSGH